MARATFLPGLAFQFLKSVLNKTSRRGVGCPQNRGKPTTYVGSNFRIRRKREVQWEIASESEAFLPDV